VCGILLLVMIITFPRDEAALNELLKQLAREMRN
jgi:hypothetical protein